MCQASTLRTWPWIQMRAWKSYGMRYVFILYISMDNYVLFPSSRPCIVIHLMLVLLWMVILHWKLQSEVLLKVFRLVLKDNFAFFFYFILFFVFSTFSLKKVDARRGFLCWIRFNKVCPWYKQWFFFFFIGIEGDAASSRDYTTIVGIELLILWLFPIQIIYIKLHKSSSI